MKISHTDILVKIDENTELIEAPIMSYDKNSYKAPIYKTNEFNKLQLASGEYIVSLAQLMTINISSYITALRNINSELDM